MSAIKNVGYFLTAVILSRAMGFFQSYFIARALGPENFGIWATLLLIVSYVPIFCLGTVETLSKQVPFFLGRNDLPRAREIEGSVLGSLVFSSSFVVLLALLTPVVVPMTTFHVGAGMLALVLVTVAINFFSAFFYYRFSAYENFKMTGAMDAVRAAFSLLLVGGMGWVWKLQGAVTGYFLMEIVMFFVTAGLNIRAYGKPGIRFHRHSIMEAIRTGFPISLLWWVLTLTASMDRLVLGGMLGAAAVGYYAFGISLSGIVFLVPTVLGRVLYPKVNKHFGANADAASMRRVVLAPTLALATLLVNFQIGLLIGAPLIYNVLLPKYKAGLVAGQIIILGSFFVCLFRNAANYLIAANQERLFLKYIVGTLAFNLVSDISLVKAGFGLEGVAVGTSLAGCFLTTMVWRRVMIGLGFDRRRQWRTLFELYLPMLVALFVCGILEIVFHSLFQSFDIRSIVEGLLSLILVNGLLWCFPMYRAEALTWWERIRGKRFPGAPQATVTDSAC